MKISIDAPELRKILNEKFGENNFYELTFLEGDYAVKQKLGIEKWSEAKRIPPNTKTNGMRIIVEGMSILVTEIEILD